MKYFGDFDTGATVYIPFNTFDTSGASVTVTDLVAGDVEIHKDGGTTQRASDSGVSVAIDFDGVTGNHIVTIDLSDNADAGFYASGHDYSVRLEGITVDSQTINAFIGSFSIENRYMRGTDDAYTGTPPTTTAIKDAIEAEGSHLAAIKDKTDGLNFTGTDVKATLDGEEVVTDSASREASKATGFAVAGDAMTLTAAYEAAKTAAQAGDAMTLTEAYDDAKTAAQTSDVTEVKDAVDTLSRRLYGD